MLFWSMAHQAAYIAGISAVNIVGASPRQRSALERGARYSCRISRRHAEGASRALCVLSFRLSALPALGHLSLPLTVAAMSTALVRGPLPLAHLALAVCAHAVFLLGPLVIIKVFPKLVVAAFGAPFRLAFFALALALPWPLLFVKVCSRLVAVAL